MNARMLHDRLAAQLAVGILFLGLVPCRPGVALAGMDEPVALQDLPKLAETLKPTVVNISTKSKVSVEDEFPGLPFEFGPHFKHPRQIPQRGQGSGFVWSEDGAIITNNHVVEGANEIRVTFADGKEVKAKILGRDPKTDIALIQAEGVSGLAAVRLGDSDALKIGEWVIAIGNPFGLGHTITTGIVSAKSRVLGGGPYDDFIQTDAAINPGNSGGPLFDFRGEVVGINAAIEAQAQGIGFAIPVNLARTVVTQLKEKGRVIRGWLGVGIQQLTADLAENFGAKEGKGALVSQVFPESPAGKVGIERGDVIVRFDGKEVGGPRELSLFVAETPVGKKVTVVALRNGKEKEFEPAIAEREEKESEEASGQEEKSGSRKLGIQVSDLTPELAQKLRAEGKKGVVVLGVEQGSAAAEAGIQRGDLIEEVNRKKVASVRDMETVLDKSAGKGIVFLIFREGSSLFLSVTPP